MRQASAVCRLRLRLKWIEDDVCAMHASPFLTYKGLRKIARVSKTLKICKLRRKERRTLPASDCRQKAILPPEGGRIALSANERIDEFLDFAIQAKFAYVNKLRRALPAF